MTVPASEIYQCPTRCDDDCDIQGWGCHETHDAPRHQKHDPEACEALALAGNLAWLAVNGWQFTFSRLTDGPYQALLVNAPALRYQVQDGLTLGEAALKARDWAQRRSRPPATAPAACP